HTPPSPASSPPTRPVRTPRAALQALLDGNRRWRTSTQRHPNEDPAARRRAIAGQAPFAVVLGCIDSRVPPEHVFDQGLGDLLTPRSAGQVLDESVIGSVEYGVVALRIPLVVVLGHQSCGAVKSAIEIEQTGEQLPGSIQYIAERIWPAIDQTQQGDARLNATTDANALMIRDQLAALPTLATRIAAGQLSVVSARYELTDQSVRLLP
ncbi:carbonic anhydrase, partial [Streptomyces clavuligerus]